MAISLLSVQADLNILRLKLRYHQDQANVEREDAKRLSLQVDALRNEKNVLSVQHSSYKKEASAIISKLTNDVQHLTSELQNANAENKKLQTRITELEIKVARQAKYTETDIRLMYNLRDEIQGMTSSIDGFHRHHERKAASFYEDDFVQTEPPVRSSHLSKLQPASSSQQKVDQNKLPMRTRKNNTSSKSNKRKHALSSPEKQHLKEQQRAIWDDIQNNNNRHKRMAIEDEDNDTIPYDNIM